MGARNETAKSFYKLKKDEDKDSLNFNRLMFYPQVKRDGRWGDDTPINCMEGYLTNIVVDPYEYEGRKNYSLKIELLDNDNPDHTMIFQIGLRSRAGQDILNALAGEPELGVVKFVTGKPKEINGKMYPTLFVNTQKTPKGKFEITKWKYGPKTNNLHEIVRPKYEGEYPNLIVTGQEESDNFWISLIDTDIKHKYYTRTTATDNGFGDVNTATADQAESEQDDFIHDENPVTDLPF